LLRHLGRLVTCFIIICG